MLHHARRCTKHVQSRLDSGHGRNAREPLRRPRRCARSGSEDAEERKLRPAEWSAAERACSSKSAASAALMNPRDVCRGQPRRSFGYSVLRRATRLADGRAALRRQVVALVQLHEPDSGGTGEAGEPRSCMLTTRDGLHAAASSQVLDTPSPDNGIRARSPCSADAASDAAVAFDHVSLRYPGAGAESLSDVSFTAAPGADHRRYRRHGQRQNDARQPDSALL